MCNLSPVRDAGRVSNSVLVYDIGLVQSRGREFDKYFDIDTDSDIDY